MNKLQIEKKDLDKTNIVILVSFFWGGGDLFYINSIYEDL